MNTYSLAAGLLGLAMLGPVVSDLNGTPWCLRQDGGGTEKPIVYFPENLESGFTSFFSQCLNLVHEPSLLAGAGDQKNEIYRVDWLSGQHGYMTAVRIVLNGEGSGTVVTKKLGTASSTLEKQRTLSENETKGFLQLVENAKFWSSPTAVENPKKPKGYKKTKDQRTAYQMDASPWIFEGSRNGNYCAVGIKKNKSQAVADVVKFLMKEGIELLQE